MTDFLHRRPLACSIGRKVAQCSSMLPFKLQWLEGIGQTSIGRG